LTIQNRAKRPGAQTQLSQYSSTNLVQKLIHSKNWFETGSNYDEIARYHTRFILTGRHERQDGEQENNNKDKNTGRRNREMT
jgi:hypothetical protein